MRKKIIVNVNDLTKVDILEKFGTITYIDDYVNVVFMDTSTQQIPTMENFDFVIRIEEAKLANLL